MTIKPPKPILSEADWARFKNLHDNLVASVQHIIEIQREGANPMLFLLFEVDQPSWEIIPLDVNSTTTLFEGMKHGAIDDFARAAFLNEEQFKSIGILRGILQLNEGWLSSIDDDLNCKPAPEGYLDVTPHADGRIEILMLLFRFPSGLLTVSHGIQTLPDGSRKLVPQPFPTQDEATVAKSITTRNPFKRYGEES